MAGIMETRNPALTVLKKTAVTGRSTDPGISCTLISREIIAGIEEDLAECRQNTPEYRITLPGWIRRLRTKIPGCRQ